jgi:hypothetical protein
MKNNEWNVPSDYFEKNKKALIPVRKFATGKWILALAAACVIGVGLFMVKGDGQTQEVAQGKRREEKVREGKNGEDVGAKNLSPNIGEDIGAKNLSTKEDVGAKNLSPEMEDVGSKNLSTQEDIGSKHLSPRIAEELKEIPREELVAYLLEEDSDFIENID